MHVCKEFMSETYTPHFKPENKPSGRRPHGTLRPGRRKSWYLEEGPLRAASDEHFEAHARQPSPA